MSLNKLALSQNLEVDRPFVHSSKPVVLSRLIAYTSLVVMVRLRQTDGRLVPAQSEGAGRTEWAHMNTGDKMEMHYSETPPPTWVTLEFDPETLPVSIRLDWEEETR